MIGDAANWRILGPVTKCCGNQSESKPASRAVRTCAESSSRCAVTSKRDSVSRVTNRPACMAKSFLVRHWWDNRMGLGSFCGHIHHEGHEARKAHEGASDSGLAPGVKKAS